MTRIVPTRQVNEIGSINTKRVFTPISKLESFLFLFFIFTSVCQVYFCCRFFNIHGCNSSTLFSASVLSLSLSHTQFYFKCKARQCNNTWVWFCFEPQELCSNNCKSFCDSETFLYHFLHQAPSSSSFQQVFFHLLSFLLLLTLISMIFLIFNWVCFLLLLLFF